MKMYKVFLVDDEPFILEGLKYIVEWEEYGFEIVGVANNGEEALKQILSQDIDLVITDIMMPKMTGLELITGLNKENYKTNFIMISAFQEFEYAKQAMSMGAENYILKPIDEEELTNSIKSAYNKLKHQEELKKREKIEQNNILLKVITEGIGGFTNKEIEKINIKSEKYSVAIVELKKSNIKIKDALRQLINEEEILYCVENRNKALLIIDKDDKANINKLTDLKNNIMTLTESTVYMSLGKEVDSIELLEQSYQTAKEVSEYKIIYPNISWIKEYKERVNDEDSIDIQFEELKSIVSSNQFDNIELYIGDIFKNLRVNEGICPKKIKIKALEVFIRVYNYFNEAKVMNGLHTHLENAISRETIDEIEIELLSMIKYIHLKLENTQESISPIILKLLKYVDKNYQKDLNLKEISDDLNINSIYLGQLFQKETGSLFSDYINNYRINKAKDLLINTSLKASEIGELVGYSNKNYFYRKFKNIIGITPSEWRKINI